MNSSDSDCVGFGGFGGVVLIFGNVSKLSSCAVVEESCLKISGCENFWKKN